MPILLERIATDSGTAEQGELLPRRFWGGLNLLEEVQLEGEIMSDPLCLLEGQVVELPDDSVGEQNPADPSTRRIILRLLNVLVYELLLARSFALDEESNCPVNFDGDIAVAVLDRVLLRDLALETVVIEDILEELDQVHDRIRLIRATVPCLAKRAGEAAESVQEFPSKRHGLTLPVEVCPYLERRHPIRARGVREEVSLGPWAKFGFVASSRPFGSPLRRRIHAAPLSCYDTCHEPQAARMGDPEWLRFGWQGRQDL